ncbi:MAG: hypothetical protein JSU08_15520 [Acidobacteria bacterium]|nr:hypothetical protein [Acidobacteriota bacterium]
MDIMPSLYRTNAFRVIGLPVEATPKDIRRKADMLRMSETLGTPAPQGRSPLPLDATATVDEVREALQRLRDPERRLVEEIFWFWPVEPGRSVDDPALTALAQGDFKEACAIWRDTDAGGIGLHNLAVLTHALALDHEQDATRESLTLSPTDRVNINKLWRQAFLDWNAAIREEGFWQRLTQRIHELDDPRLTSASAIKIRGDLPLALLSLSARLAVQAGEQQNTADGARHLAVIRNSGFDASTCVEALRVSLGSVRQRIQALCSTAETEADADPAHADRVTTRLLDQAAPLVSVIDFLPAGDPMRDGTHDQLALSALACQIPYGNKSGDWKGSLALLERVIGVAVSDSARDRIQRNIDIVTANLAHEREIGTCWFCANDKPDERSKFVVKMYGEVVHSGTRVTWRVLDVDVPRCRGCKRKHSTADSVATLAFLALAITGFSVCGAGNAEGAALGIGWVCFFGAFALFSMVKRSIYGGIKAIGAATAFPAVERRRKDGWAVGAKPPGVE